MQESLMNRLLVSGISTLAVAAAAALGQNQPVQPVTPQYQYPPAVYQMQGVPQALNLSQQQINSLNQLSGRLQGTYRDRYGKLSSVAEADRNTRLRELNQQYQADWMTGARDIFHPPQLSRYQQLQLQQGGFNSLTNADVQRQLRLTGDQQRRLQDAANWSAQQLRDISSLGATDRDKAMRLYQDYQRQYQDRLNQLLTPEQQRTWNAMIGQPYTFQPNFGSPRR
jgi:hypothetical protein